MAGYAGVSPNHQTYATPLPVYIQYSYISTKFLNYFKWNYITYLKEPNVLQNLNLTWYTNATKWYSLNASASVGPDLTECFKDTLVRWLPLGWLFLALLLGLPCLLRARRPARLVDVPLNWLQALKLVLALCFLGVAVADIIYSAAVSSWFRMASIVLILAPALEAFMMVRVAYFVLEQKLFRAIELLL